MIKKWCSHITWRTQYVNWQLKAKRGMWLCVTRSWKVCPICQAERPTRANIKAAQNRFEMDNNL